MLMGKMNSLSFDIVCWDEEAIIILPYLLYCTVYIMIFSKALDYIIIQLFYLLVFDIQDVVC